MVLPREDRPGLGIALGVAAFGLFSVLDTSAKLLGQAGIPALQVAFLRYAVHFALVLALFVPREGLVVFRSNAPRLQLVRALCLCASTVLNFAALKYLPITLTTSVMFASPIVVCLLSIPVLGEKVGMRRLAAVGVGFIGVLVIVGPWNARFDPAILFSLGALLASSAYFIATRMVAGVDDNPTGQVFTAGVATALLLPFALVHWQPLDRPAEFGFALLAGFCGGVGHSIVTVANRFVGASTLAPVVYTQIIFVTAISWAVFGTLPTLSTLLGASIIIASGLYIWIRERRLKGG